MPRQQGNFGRQEDAFNRRLKAGGKKLYSVKGMGWLKVLDGNDEDKFFWHSSSPEEVGKAREKFADYLRQGFIACKITDDGRTGIQITEFDQDAEEIFMLGLADGG